MKEKNSKKRKVVIMIIMVVQSCVFTAPMSVIANQDEYITSNNYENYSSKIEEEISNNTGLIDENVEKLLNKRGVFDDEIKVMDDSFLEEIDEDIPLYVQTEYFEVQDSKELQNKPISEDEMKRLSLEEVDEIIGEVENEKTDCGEENTSLNNKILEAIGIKPIDVYAKTVSNSSAYLKKTIILSNTKLDDGKQYIKVNYTNYWIKAPEYRNKDMVILDFEGAFYDASSKGNTCHAKRSYKKEEYRYYYSSKLKTNYKSKIDSKDIDYTVRQGYIAVQLDLKDDIDVCYINPVTGLKEYSDVVKYTNETVGISLYLKRDTKFDGATFYGIYEHFKSKTDIASIIINSVSRNVCNLLYSTATGKNVSTYCTYAGKEFECHYYAYEFK